MELYIVECCVNDTIKRLFVARLIVIACTKYIELNQHNNKCHFDIENVKVLIIYPKSKAL